MPAIEDMAIPYSEPFDWRYLLRYLRSRAATGVEQVDGARYVRTVRIQEVVGLLTIENERPQGRLIVRFSRRLASHTALIEQGVRRIFDLDADLPHIHSVLGRDPALAPLLRRSPGVRVPGAWCPFELLVRTIVGQQVSVKAATTIMGRIASRCGRSYGEQFGSLSLFPTPRAICQSDLSAIGMPTKRVAALQSIAAAIAKDELRIDGTTAAASVKARLVEFAGVGPWTAEYFALRGLRDGDAWPATDLVLKRTVRDIAGPAADWRHAEPWRPYRGYAAMHLWNHAALATQAETAKGQT